MSKPTAARRAATPDPLAPIPWDQAPIGIFGVAIWSNGQERPACRITSAIPFFYGIVPASHRIQLPAIAEDEIPRQWRPFRDDSELRSCQIMTGSELVDLDGNTYWIRNDERPRGGWIKVTKERWIHHERLCGFVPKLASNHPNFRRVCATGGFTGGGPGGRYSGSFTTDGKPPQPREHYP